MIKAYQKGEAKLVEVQTEQVGEASEFGAFFDDIDAYSVVDNSGNIISVMGYFLYAENVAMCVALIGQNSGPYLMEMIRFCLNKIPFEMERQHIKRVLMTVKKDFLNASKMARLLGFHQTAELKSFYKNDDYQLFERENKC